MRHDAHFVEELAVEQTEAIGRHIPSSQLSPNPHQPRQTFNDLNELIASIQQVGVLEPLLVRRQGEELYQIVSGERRFRAAQTAGLTELPCIVLEVDDAQALEIALIENLQRQDLSAFEEAEGLQALVEEFGYTHEEVAARISKSRITVTEVLTLATVPSSVRTLLEEAGVHTKSILLEIARQDDEEAMLQLTQRVLEEGLTRDMVRALRKPTASPKPAPARNAKSPRRLTFRSSTGVTVSLYISASEVSLAEIERSLLDAIRQLRSTGLPA